MENNLPKRIHSVICVRNKKESRLYYYIVFLGDVLKSDTKLFMNEALVEIDLAKFLSLKVDLQLTATDHKENDLEEIHIYI
jgi:hypothetical protein